MKYPAFVWKKHPTREGFVTPEIWAHECHTGAYLTGGKLEVVPHAAMHELSETDQKLDMELLIRLFPPPDGWKHWRQPHAVPDLSRLSVRSDDEGSTANPLP